MRNLYLEFMEARKILNSIKECSVKNELIESIGENVEYVFPKIPMESGIIDELAFIEAMEIKLKENADNVLKTFKENALTVNPIGMSIPSFITCKSVKESYEEVSGELLHAVTETFNSEDICQINKMTDALTFNTVGVDKELGKLLCCSDRVMKDKCFCTDKDHKITKEDIKEAVEFLEACSSKVKDVKKIAEEKCKKYKETSTELKGDMDKSAKVVHGSKDESIKESKSTDSEEIKKLLDKFEKNAADANPSGFKSILDAIYKKSPTDIINNSTNIVRVSRVIVMIGTFSLIGLFVDFVISKKVNHQQIVKLVKTLETEKKYVENKLKSGSKDDEKMTKYLKDLEVCLHKAEKYKSKVESGVTGNHLKNVRYESLDTSSILANCAYLMEQDLIDRSYIVQLESQIIEMVAQSQKIVIAAYMHNPRNIVESAENREILFNLLEDRSEVLQESCESILESTEEYIEEKFNEEKFDNLLASLIINNKKFLDKYKESALKSECRGIVIDKWYTFIDLHKAYEKIINSVEKKSEDPTAMDNIDDLKKEYRKLSDTILGSVLNSYDKDRILDSGIRVIKNHALSKADVKNAIADLENISDEIKVAKKRHKEAFKAWKYKSNIKLNTNIEKQKRLERKVINYKQQMKNSIDSDYIGSIRNQLEAKQRQARLVLLRASRVKNVEESVIDDTKEMNSLLEQIMNLNTPQKILGEAQKGFVFESK